VRSLAETLAHRAAPPWDRRPSCRRSDRAAETRQGPLDRASVWGLSGASCLWWNSWAGIVGQGVDSSVSRYPMPTVAWGLRCKV